MMRSLARWILGITAQVLETLQQIPAFVPDGLFVGDDPAGARRFLYRFIVKIDDHAPDSFRFLGGEPAAPRRSREFHWMMLSVATGGNLAIVVHELPKFVRWIVR